MGTVTMFAAGKDGVGKSTVSVFVGAALARMGETVLVIELDSGLRSIDVISGVYGKLIYDINDVLSRRCGPLKAIVDSPLSHGFYVMSAPFVHEKLDVRQFVRLCKALSERYDRIIIDTAASVEARDAAAAVADSAVVLTTPDPIGVRNAKLTTDFLMDNAGIDDVRLIISRVQPSRIYEGIIPSLDYCIDNVGIQLVGVVPESDDLALASAGIKALKRDSLAAKVMDNIAKRLSGNNIPLAVE